MKIALFNDTAPFAHFGCQAVSDGHARLLGRAGHVITERFFMDWNHGIPNAKDIRAIDHLLRHEDFRRRIDAVDAVVVNGEGTIHHGAGLHLLAVLGAAQQLGKITLLVNAVYEETEFFEDVLKRLDDFTVRDRRSLNYAASRGLRARLVRDSSFAAEHSPNMLADVSGKAVVSDWHSSRSSDVGSTLKRYLAGHPETAFYLPFERADASICWNRIVPTLKRAAVFLTARHHGVCFAVKAGIPFVALPSNTFKIEGFLEEFGPKVPIAASIDELRDGEAWSAHNRQYFIDIAERVAQRGPLDTFSVLGRGNDGADEAREVRKLASDLAAHQSSALISGEWETYALSRRMHEALHEPPKQYDAIKTIRLQGVLGGYNQTAPADH